MERRSLKFLLTVAVLIHTSMLCVCAPAATGMDDSPSVSAFEGHAVAWSATALEACEPAADHSSPCDCRAAKPHVTPSATTLGASQVCALLDPEPALLASDDTAQVWIAPDLSPTTPHIQLRLPLLN